MGTENDYRVATYLMMTIAVNDFLRNGMDAATWERAASDAEDHALGGFQVIAPDFSIDSDFTFGYSLNGYWTADILFEILELGTDAESRNAFIVDNRELLCFPEPRRSRTATDAFGGWDYDGCVRPLLVMIDYDGKYSNMIQRYDAMQR